MSKFSRAKEYLIKEGINLTLEELEETCRCLVALPSIPNKVITTIYYVDPTFVETDSLPNLIEVEENEKIVFDTNRELKIWYCGKDVVLWYMSSDGKAEEAWFMFNFV